MIYSRPRFALLYLTASCLWLLITRSSAAPCDNAPAETVPPGNNDWTLVTADCGPLTHSLSVSDADTADPLTFSLATAVPGITFQGTTKVLECDATQLTGQSSYTLDISVDDTCPTNGVLNFQITVTFTDITASTNVNAPQLTPLAYNVVKDFFETAGGSTAVDVTTLTGTDADTGDDVASVTITGTNPASAPFSIVATGTTSEFTLRLTGSLASVTSPVTLMLDVVDSGTSGMPSRTAAVTLTLTIDARPVFTSPADGDTLYFCEDFSGGDAIHNLTYTDADSSSGITFSVPNYDVTSVPFEIDAATDELRVASSVTAGTFDVDALTGPLTYSVQLRVSDGTYDSTITVTLVVDDVNDIAPVLSPSPIPDQNVVQSLSADSTILEFTTSDGDRDAPNNVVTLTLSGTNNEHFYFDGNFLSLQTPSMLNYSLVPEYNLVVMAVDGAYDPVDVLSATAAIRIVVETEPVIVNKPTAPTPVPEDTAAGLAVYTFTSTDDDNVDVITLTYSITNQVPVTPVPFEFVGAELRTVAGLTADVLDSEALTPVTSYTLDVEVSDGTYTDSTTLTITVTDVNDQDPVFDANSYTAAIHEDTAAGTSVFDVGATDADATAANNVITYSITGTNSDHFVIDGSTGLVTVASPSGLDYATVSSYTLDIVATDSGTPARAATVTATITIEASPVFVKPAAGEIPTEVAENTAAETAVYTFSSNDPDTLEASLVYTMDSQVPSTPAPFEIVGNQLKTVVGLTPDVLDSEATGTVTSYTISVTVDDGQYTDTTTLTLTITDVNDEDPVFNANSYANAINEDTAAGTTVLDVGATDADVTAANNVITYSITTGTNSDHFVIDGATGEITVASPSMLSYDSVTSYTLDIVATDSGTPPLSATVAATITIEASPVFVKPAAGEIPTEVAENTAAETAVYTFSSNDPDTLEASLVYTMDSQVPSTPAPFEIVGNQLKTVVGLTPDVLDSEATGTVTSYTISVTVDDGQYTDTTTLTLTITDVNDEDPVFNANSYANAINEDTAAGTTVLDVGATDADVTAANNVITYSITTGTNSDHFVIDGATGEITVASPSMLSYDSVTSYTLDIVATDSGTPPLSATVAATITIEASPVFVKPAAGEIPTEVAENTAAETAVYTFSSNDPDTLEASLVYTMDSQVPSTPAPFEIVGNQLKTVVGLTPDVLDSEATGTVTSYTISVTVDDGQYTDTTTLTLTITDVNDEDPVFNANSYANAINEDTAAGTTVLDVGATDADVTAANNVITYSITTGTNSDHFVIDGATGEITVASPSMLSYDSVTSYTLDIVATDSGTPPLSATVAATITIEASPVFVKPAAGEIPTEVAENTAAETAVYTFSSNDPDTLEASLVYTMDSQVPSTPAPFEIVGNQLKTVVGLTPDVLDSEATGTVTSYTISVTVDDGQYTGTATLTLTITDVNDEDPVFDANSYANAINEDTAAGTTVLDVGATDADVTAANNVITYSITTGTNSDHFVIDGATGEITVASPSMLNYSAVESYTLDIVATDSGTPPRSTNVAATITIETTPVLVRPADGEDATEIEEVKAANELVYSFVATDQDAPTADLTYTIEAQVPASPVPFVIVNDELKTKAVLSADLLDQDSTSPVGTYTFTIRVSDGSYSDEGELVINILDTNDKPPVFTQATYTMNIPEDANGIIGTVAAVDGDLTSPNNIVAYTITGGNGEGLFAMDSAAISLTDLVKEVKYELTVTATDGGTPANSVTANVVVNVDKHAVDECVLNGGPCENGATCRQNVNYYYCDCADGWDGATCTLNIDECDPDPCENGGTCVDGVASYTCDCEPGWGGDNCTEACMGHTYGANCATACSCNDSHVATTTAAQDQKCNIVTGACVCNEHWTGMSCDDDATECGQGTTLCTAANTACQDTFGSFQCVCETGYTPGASNVCVQDMSDSNPINLPAAVVTAANGRGSKTVVVKVSLDANCDGINLRDPDVYDDIKVSLETQHGQQDLGLSVLVFNISCGSLNYNLFVETVNTTTATVSLSQKLKDLRDSGTMDVDGQTAAVQDMTVNSDAVPTNNRLCSIYESLSPCGTDYTCYVENGTPRCREDEDDNTELILGVGIGVGVGGLLLVGLLIACIVMAQRRKRRAKRFGNGDRYNKRGYNDDDDRNDRRRGRSHDRSHDRSADIYNSGYDDRFDDRYADRPSSKSYAQHGTRMHDQMYDNKDVVMVPYKHADDYY